VATGLLELARRVAPDVIVLAGDLTQRAKVREYEQARAYLREFKDVPVVVTPGNHDIPLYRVHERLFFPFRNYRTFISQELDTATQVGRAVLVALNSADPLRGLINGRIEERQLRFLARIFQELSGVDVRIVVTHHALAPPPDGGSGAVMPRNESLLDRFRELGVDLILSGHFHRGFVTSSSEVRPDHRDGGDIVIVHSGTAASSRGRAAEKGKNSVNVLKIGTERIEVISHWFEQGRSAFVAREPIMIQRGE
jgi:3',5'-cyclic AMP phosphodiesterase CpdA